MKILFTFSLICLLVSFSANAQVSYSFTATTGTYTPLSGATIANLSSPSPDYNTTDEGYVNNVPLGFTFTYNGVDYTTVNINVNGFITLGAGFVNDDFEDYYFNSLSGGPGTQTSVRPVIAPLWDDLELNSDNNLTYKLTGSAPDRVFTIQWENARWRYTASDPGISFQVKLYETTNIIEFVYNDETGEVNTPTASIGLSATRTGTGNFLSLSESSASPSASSTEETTTIDAKPATNQLYRFTPLACIAPSITELTDITATSATFSWNAIAGASGYEYAASTSPTPPSSGTATSQITAAITGLTPGVTKYFYVRTSCGGGVFSDWSKRAIVICTTNLLPADGATGVSNSPTLSWNSIDNATAYTIMFSAGGLDYSNIGTVSGSTTSTSLADLNLTLNYNTTYYFYVRPLIESDTASVACEAGATSFTTTDPPIIPCTTNITPVNGATNVSPASTIISWNEVEGANYLVMFSVDGGNSYDALGTTDTTAVNLGGFGLIDYNSTYAFYIRPIINFDTASLLCESNATSFTTSGQPPAPANDDCNNATLLTVLPANFTNLGATESMPTEGCNTFIGNTNDDVWFKFTAVNNGTAIISLTNASIGLDAVIEAYSGTCGSLTALDCADNTLDGENETLILSNLTAGETYLFRVYGFADPVDGGTFTLQISGSALPISLTNFRGERQGEKNVLIWSTQMEYNSQGFELQRSPDGSNFTSLNIVNSKATNGYSTTTLNYIYSDTRPFKSNSYYRLKQLDRDGRFVYSTVVLLKSVEVTRLQLNLLYPNPAKSELNMIITSPSNSKIDVILTDVVGKTIMQRNTQLTTGDNNLKLDISNLPAGSYIIKALCTDGCGNIIKKFVKQ